MSSRNRCPSTGTGLICSRLNWPVFMSVRNRSSSTSGLYVLPRNLVNRLSDKGDVTKEILLALVNRNDDVNVAALLLKSVPRWIDYDIQKTFRDVKALNQMRSLLHVCGYERQPFFKPRISLACRPYHVLKQSVGRLMRVSIEHYRAQDEARAFSDIQTQPVPGFDHVVHVHFRVAVFSVKNFKKKREIVRASGA